jgi:hypothetical protein
MIHPLDRRDDSPVEFPKNPRTEFTPVHLGWFVVASGFLLALIGAIILGQEKIAWEDLGDVIHFLSKLVLVIGLLVLLIAYRSRESTKQQIEQVKRADKKTPPQEDIVMLELVDPIPPERFRMSIPEPKRATSLTTPDLLRQMSDRFPATTDQPPRSDPSP